MVSEQDRQRLRRVAKSLAAIELNEPADPAVIEAAVAAANRRRIARGEAALVTEGPPPEEEFYRRARALGLRRRRG